ncbi:hypothetical protein SLEP1_g14486 [Rubroshorea leprosula]|uniref:DUF4220 domain-containing protein n=1 Tax=Rubroshorea leprosula TaxID=152421 RepID=A0AAV5IT89_9ROSI|nr:hypothetical protein SLEP1_g14486 [Rubroshorea leprosula]
MAVALSLTEKAQKLWNAWSIRGLMIVSLSLQVILNLLAPKRKVQSGWGKWIIGLIWFVYFLADWVATSTMGLILHRTSPKSGGPPIDIIAFWTPFLLVHLGGPDTITSYSLQDNELWQRHFLALLSQVFSTFYAFFKSSPNNELWLATILVLLAGIIKYFGRTLALNRASFDKLGKNWVPVREKTGLVIPKQFHGMENHPSISGTAVLLFSNLKRILVGPLPKENELKRIIERIMVQRSDGEVLRIFEIELSLLYEVLHTKLPLIDSKIGSYFRMANFGCILVALILFSLVKKHYELELSDILITYGLLIGALAMDVLSLILIKSSDWFAISHIQDGSQLINKRELPDAVIKRRRWSKTVSQLNFLTHHVKKLDDLTSVGTLLSKVINNFHCQSFQYVEDSLWSFILREIKMKFDCRHCCKNKGEKEVWLSEEEFEKLLEPVMNQKHQELIKNLTGKLDYTQTLLVWHIATELCFQNTDHRWHGTTDTYRSICKQLSDYMFYLAEMQPTMMAGVLDNWKDEFKRTSKQTRSLVPWKSFSNEKSVAKKILFGSKEVDVKIEEEEDEKMKLLSEAVEVARGLEQEDGYPWEGMNKVWVHLMCYAAIKCRPNVHADQLSKAGELLTFVWLLMSHFGFGTKYRTLRE